MSFNLFGQTFTQADDFFFPDAPILGFNDGTPVYFEMFVATGESAFGNVVDFVSPLLVDFSIIGGTFGEAGFGTAQLTSLEAVATVIPLPPAAFLLGGIGLLGASRLRRKPQA